MSEEYKAKSSPPIWLGVVSVIVILFIGSEFFHLYASAKVASQKMADLANAKQIAIGIAMYQSDSGDKFPPLESTAGLKKNLYWYLKNDQLIQAIPKMTWNTRLSMVDAKLLLQPADTWLFHSMSSGDDGRYIMAFTDCHVKRMQEEEMNQFLSKPLSIDKPSKD